MIRLINKALEHTSAPTVTSMGGARQPILPAATDIAIRLANRANAQTRTIRSAYGAHGVLT
jgi:hypothetical protein